MTPEQVKEIAQQLRKPEGENGKTIAEKMNVGNGPMNLHTLAALNPDPQENILEIGMANGWFVPRLLKLEDDIHYTGVDYSPDMVQLASNLNQHWVQSNRATFIEADLHDLPFEGESFHTIFTINTLYFWDQREEALNELWRVLKPGGKLIISIRPDYVMKKIPFTGHNFRLYGKDETLAMLNQFGFEQPRFTHVIEPVDYSVEEEMRFPRETMIFECKKPNN